MISWKYHFYNSRSVGPKSIPEHLNLEKIESKGKISPKQLSYLIRYCPNVKSIKCKYLPNDADIKELERSTSLQIYDEVDRAITNNSNNEGYIGEEINSMFNDDDAKCLDQNQLK